MFFVGEIRRKNSIKMDWRRDVPNVRIIRRLRGIWNRTDINNIFNVAAMPDYIISCLTQRPIYPRRVKLVSFFWYNGITYNDFERLLSLAHRTPGRVHQLNVQQQRQMFDLWTNFDNGLYVDRYFTWSIYNDRYEFLNGTVRVRQHQGRRRDLNNPIRRVIPMDTDEVRC